MRYGAIRAFLAGFACGSFHKAILDEEMMRYSNRVLQEWR
jgi:hypothetical protein